MVLLLDPRVLLTPLAFAPINTILEERKKHHKVSLLLPNGSRLHQVFDLSVCEQAACSCQRITAVNEMRAVVSELREVARDVQAVVKELRAAVNCSCQRAPLLQESHTCAVKTKMRSTQQRVTT